MPEKRCLLGKFPIKNFIIFQNVKSDIIKEKGEKVDKFT
jgi:hypothetical protein